MNTKRLTTQHMFFKYTVTLVANESEYHAQVVRVLLKRQLGIPPVSLQVTIPITDVKEAASSKIAATEIERGLKMAYGISKGMLIGLFMTVICTKTGSMLIPIFRVENREPCKHRHLGRCSVNLKLSCWQHSLSK